MGLLTEFRHEFRHVVEEGREGESLSFHFQVGFRDEYFDMQLDLKFI